MRFPALMLALILLGMVITFNGQEPRAQEKAQLKEADYIKQLAPKYKATQEAVQWDRSRVDLLSSEYAIEVDFASKWAEAIGQSLYYAQLTGRKPGIILLRKGHEEDRFIYRCQTVCVKYGIKLFVEKTNGR